MEVAGDTRRDMEDVIAAINFDIDNSSEANSFGDTVLGSGKDDMIELATIQVEQFVRRTMNDNQIEELAALLLETDGAQIIEIFSPKRFCRKAAALGLRPGLRWICVSPNHMAGTKVSAGISSRWFNTRNRGS